jgi:hypothetical protein
MENPAYWTEDTWEINNAIADYDEQIAQGVIGHSLAWIIEQRVVVPLREKIESLEKSKI